MAKEVRARDRRLELAADSARCLLCGCDGRTVLRSAASGEATVAESGICEACAVDAYWAWKSLLGDSAPDPEAPPQVARTLVLVTRLARLPGGQPCDPSVPESYEVALAVGVDGVLDLPSSEPDDEGAVARALRLVGMTTWPSCAETLFVGYTARGRLVRVATVTAWADGESMGEPAAHARSDVLAIWRPWVEWERSWGGMSGFYAALRQVWRLRIWRHVAEGRKTSAPTVRLRRAAVEYLRLRQLQQSGDPGADTSMLPLLRQQLTDDERAVVKLLAGAEALRAEVAAQVVSGGDGESGTLDGEAVDVEYQEPGDGDGGGDDGDDDPLAGEDDGG